MAKLNDIPGIGETSLELLEAAGFLDTKVLAKANADLLTKELTKANEVLEITQNPPSLGEVEIWIASAREREGIVDTPSPVATPAVDSAPQEEAHSSTVADPAKPVNYEENTEVAAMLDAAPLAIPLPAKLLMDNHLKVSEIPPAILLSRYSGDLEVRVEDRTEAPKPQAKPQIRTVTGSGTVQTTFDAPGSRLDIDVSRIKSIDEIGPAPKKVISSKAGHEEDRVALLRTPREKTNRGKKPSSRRYIRGVLHSHPIGLYFGAVITLVLMAILPLAIISAALLLLSDQLHDEFYWVPKWILAFPIALPVIAIAYMIWGFNGRCRICGQRLFYPKNCLKNSKAHRIPGLGHIIPVSIHMILFRWFRCTFCGTPVRLKK
ncbi:DUF4332 domain-containing protein [Luteolibacter pohnpeiensis]|uniref:DUF4332 domain-containing protein n=1 Tax=Luteolibacter pohnpeiensis TaxID=454153 RepID=A0A934VT31_9BACT|nr:DUF4332 domain-containing protein [Luteolibacter pohnpeiensis]MBK1881062.1 DUF4332 domain-containing protein [Luteolibacter pohnpeiensis]